MSIHTIECTEPNCERFQTTMMLLNQLFKCVSCSSKNESNTRETFSFSAINEMSEIVFDQGDDQQMNEETNDALPGLTKTQANEALAEVWNRFVDSQKTNYDKELNLRMFIHTQSGKTFRWTQCTNDGDRPDSGRSLWILMYGCDVPTNEDDIKLSESGSIWLVPRCSTDWQQEYIDLMLDRIIEHHIIVNEVNPNRVFLVGISSSGSDGVYQLAPRMADRWTAAGVLGGYPNNASPLPLRNLPFALFISGEKNSQNNKFAASVWAESLEQCSREHFSGGYHYWIKSGNVEEQRQDALAWMNKYTRNPWPTRVVWQHPGYISHKRFYWLALPFPEQIKKGQMIIGEVRNRRNIYLEQIPEEMKALTIRLSDTLVNLDQLVGVYVYKETGPTRIFQSIVPRTRVAIDKSIEERADPMSAATAFLHVIKDSNASIISCHSPADTELACSICSMQTNST